MHIIQITSTNMATVQNLEIISDIFHVWCEAFTVDVVNKIFSGQQRHLLKFCRRFEGHLCPRFQGCRKFFPPQSDDDNSIIVVATSITNNNNNNIDLEKSLTNG